MLTDYTAMVWAQIEEATRQVQRDLRRGVLPREVKQLLPYARAEGSLRRDMLAMSQWGRLVRVGGATARRGYRLPTIVEQVSWSLNAGRWPVGTEAA